MGQISARFPAQSSPCAPYLSEGRSVLVKEDEEPRHLGSLQPLLTVDHTAPARR